jgi:hypothetical protein
VRRGLALGAAVVVLAACGSATDGGSAGSGPTAAPPASATVPSTTAVVASTTTAAPPETLGTAVVAGPAALTVLGPDGQVRWEAPPTAGFVSATQAAIGDGVVLAATICDGPVALRAWDLDSGAPLWSAVLPDSQAGGAVLAVTDGVALATTAGGVWAFDGRSGAPREGWSPAPPATDGTTAPGGAGPAGGPLVTAAGVTITSPGCPTPGTD